MGVSKTDFTRGLQCHKMLWLDAHKPEEKIIPPEVQAKLDAGNEFGDIAMGIFGDFLETTTFKEDGRLDYAAMIKKTTAWLQEGKSVVCEGAFTWYGNYCAADILKKDGNGYALYEVKNTYAVRKEFILDLGFQRFILRKCGVPLTKSCLILRGDLPEDTLIDEEQTGELVEKDGQKYRIVDVTAAAKQAERIADKQVFPLGKLKKKDAEMPAISMGEHCDSPYRCWYYEYCNKT